MKSYKHFSTSEREIIEKLLKNNWSIRKIAKLLERSASSVSREISRNTKRYEYTAEKAKSRYLTVRKFKCHKTAMYNNPELVLLLRDLIMNKRFSPEQISSRLKLEGSKIAISYVTIYRYIKAGKLEIPKFWGERIVHKYLRRKGKKRKNGYTKRSPYLIPNHIEDRPYKAEQRLEIGHWEGDTVIGKQGGACLLTLVDRKTRFTLVAKCENKSASAINSAMLKLLQNVPSLTITPDRGLEFSGHSEITNKIGAVFYFPKPAQPWKRGTNENTNGLIREFIPKGKSIDNISEEEILEFINKINNRPRKCLNYRTAYEAFYNIKTKLF